MKIASAVLMAAVVSIAGTASPFAGTLPDFASGPASSRPMMGPLADPPGMVIQAEGPGPSIECPAPHARYLIITDGSLVAPFEGFASWKRRGGTRTDVRTLRWIRHHYRQAIDDAERIRLCIRDAYARGTRWVLLGGDTQVIPSRVVHSDFLAGLGHGDYPSDYYYACLDGTWNADGDEFFGEPPSFGQAGDDVDIVPEVFVGRAPVRTVSEARAFVDKTIDFASGRAGPESNKTLLFAEVLLPKPWDGSRGPDLLDLARFPEQLVSQYAALPGFDPVRLYENHDDPSYRPGALPETRASVLEHLGRGHALSVFWGGGSAFQMSVGPDLLSIGDLSALRSSGRPTNLLSFTSLTHDIREDCIGEAFLKVRRGGAVTSLGPSTLTFVGQEAAFRREYFRLLLEENVTTAGELAERARLGPHSDVYRGQGGDYVLSAILLGDPQLPIRPAPSRAARRDASEPEVAVVPGDETADLATAAAASTAAWPNPARERVSISLDLTPGTTRPLSVSIYDLAGRRIRRLASVASSGGRLTASWDLKDDSGRRVGDGVYFLSVQLGDARTIRRLLVVR